MTLYFIVLGIITYLLGIWCYIVDKTSKIKFYEGEMYDYYEKLTPKVARKSLIWPIFLLIYIIKSIIWTINEFLFFIFILFGFDFDYENTKIFKKYMKSFELRRKL